MAPNSVIFNNKRHIVFVIFLPVLCFICLFFVFCCFLTVLGLENYSLQFILTLIYSLIKFLS